MQASAIFVFQIDNVSIDVAGASNAGNVDGNTKDDAAAAAAAADDVVRAVAVAVTLDKKGNVYMYTQTQ